MFAGIINQTEPSIEIIIVNDGSTDNSVEIINKFLEQDIGIHFINNSEPSGNPGAPRNQGIAVASGKYIGFVDSDDWIDIDYYERLIDSIERNSADIAFASGYKDFLNGEYKNVKYNSDFYNSTNPSLRSYHESFMIWDKIYRTDLIKQYSINLGETKAAVDVPFILKAYYHLKKAAFAETSGYNYRRQSDSSVTKKYRQSSNCQFEFQAYADVDRWSRSSNIPKPYQETIQFRKLSSYLYTLRIISSEFFIAFFEQVKSELRLMDHNSISKLSKCLLSKKL